MKVAQTFDPELFWLSIFVGDVELVRIKSSELKPVFTALEEHLKKLGKTGQDADGSGTCREGKS
jgi:hypothetical protein